MQAKSPQLDLGPGYLPEFIHKMVEKPPAAGQGAHHFLFDLARVLHPWRTDSQITDILFGYAETCGRYVPDREIADAIDDSRDYAWAPGTPGMPSNRPRGRRTPPWAPVDQDLLRKICLEGIALVDLWEASPIRFEDSEVHTQEIVDPLFPDDPWLCAALTKYNFATLRREEWRGKLSDQAFIVPSPMLSKTGVTKHGTVSEHAASAVGPRRFLVVECDFSEKNRAGTADTAFAPLIRELTAAGITVADMCASILWHLAKLGPLALAVHSGGKSLHAWFYAQDRPENKLRRFFNYAHSLGADEATWLPIQLVRMPDGLRRQGGKAIRQTVFYFNPQVIPP